MNAPTPLDLNALKAKQQGAWASGDYAVVGTTLQLVGELLAEACDIHWDEQVLDVAAGNGNATLAAARRGAEVTSTDYVPALLERGAERARAEGLQVHFQTADAEALPFRDGVFDAVLSTFGVMFTPDQAKAAGEMLRVCRTGGRIGLANWTPEGFIGQLFKTLGRHLPPPAGAKSPSLWGTEAQLREFFPGTEIAVTRRHFPFRYRSPEHFVEVFRTWYGPVLKAFAALGEKGSALETDLIALMRGLDAGHGKGLLIQGEYLEVVITKR
jgi:SAM-dependent methyltransferase